MKVKANAPSRVATEQEEATFDDAEMKRGYRAEQVRCGKCGGTGRYYGPGGVCFSCNGNGKVLGRVYTLAKREALDEQARKRREKKIENRKQNEANAYLEGVKAYPQVYAGMAEVMDDVVVDEEVALKKWGDFIVDVARKCYNAGITEKQASSFINAFAGRKKYLERIEADKAEAAPVVEGRQAIRGEVVSLQNRETPYGLQLKMLLKEERGFKLWGTVPADLRSADVAKGDVIEIETATVEQSKDDETFGFFSRPRGGTIITKGGEG